MAAPQSSAVASSDSASKSTTVVLNGTPSKNAIPFREWDAGLLDSELMRQGIVPKKLDISPDQATNANLIIPEDEPEPLKTGTFSGTQKAMSAIYSRGEQR